LGIVKRTGALRPLQPAITRGGPGTRPLR
jgi:hypothetical protein